MKISFKNAFLKDLEKLPSDYKRKIEHLVFTEIPKIDNLYDIKNIKKIRGDKNYYRIRVGNYRIGFEECNGELVFMRVLHRKDIYRYFP